MNFLKKGLIAGGFYLSFCAGGFFTNVSGDIALIAVYKETKSERTRAFIGHHRPWYYRHKTLPEIAVVYLKFPYDFTKCLVKMWFPKETGGWDLVSLMDHLAEVDEQERMQKN